MSGHAMETFGGFQFFREEWVRVRGLPSDGYLNQFEKVNIRMETFSKAYSFGLEDIFVCEQGFQ